MSERIFGALLRAWRQRRGLSQLDLALSAEVSSRHVSFLETGRSQPSEGMVQRLASVLDLSLRDQNDLYVAAGFKPRFVESPTLSNEIEAVLAQMMAQQEPFPLVVLDAGYDIVRANGAALRLFGSLLGLAPGATPPASNMLALLFDPTGLRPFVRDWEMLAERLLSRLRKEMLAAPGDARLSSLFTRLCAYPEVPRFHLDPSRRLDATLPLRWNVNGETLSFLTTMTTFSVPQDVRVAELRIESFYPLDALTRARCEAAQEAVGDRKEVAESAPRGHRSG